MNQTDTTIMSANEEMWAIVELMGHGQTAGIISRPTEWGGLLRIEVPAEHGGFTTEFYGEKSIYRIKFVSEEIARAYAPSEREISIYDAPIITREKHEAIVRDLRLEIRRLDNIQAELRHRLTNIPDRLPIPPSDEGDDMGPARAGKEIDF